jgi:osmotically-inducible protein OsmY
MTDISLRKTIMEQLEFQPDIDAANIGVVVANGVVTLFGHVSSYAEKVSVERTVKAVRGVRAIAEELQVKPDKRAGVEDDRIASRALSIIQWSCDLPKDEIRVVVESGKLTLEGEVDWQYQMNAVERAVRKLTGVVSVQNRLTLRPHPVAADVQNKIEQALMRNAGIDAKGISVKVAKNVVTLEGKVRFWRERQIAERAAWSVPGVREVHVHLSFT